MIDPQHKGGWTPGPWKIDYGHPRGLPGGISTAEKGKPVTRFGAFARPSTPEALANARLIAAAPELYEALEALLEEAEDVFVCMADATGIDRHNLPQPFIAARAALAKASPDKSGGA